MKSLLARFVALCAALFLLLQAPLPALACATCGCSELCALNLFGGAVEKSKTKSLLSNSIWGRLILGIAYNRDPELERLGAAGRMVNGTSMALLAAAGATTLPQGIVSLKTLYDNPDSYVPLKIGIPLEGVTNLAIWGRMIINARVRRKVRARQAIVRANVEAILHHLQYSQWSCPEAEKQLSLLIGPQAAEECVRLWTKSHALAGIEEGKTPTAELTPQTPPAGDGDKPLTATDSTVSSVGKIKLQDSTCLKASAGI